ncbi:hypothetical protein CQ057_13290 [Ochrobactrum sp. MYb49]|nr:hypothetical protein CQ057_13290 [Ochrobactrum sp. MYb49]
MKVPLLIALHDLFSVPRLKTLFRTGGLAGHFMLKLEVRKLNTLRTAMRLRNIRRVYRGSEGACL